MVDNKGNKWTEKNYKGYGVFHGKDFYQLLAEMNNVEGLVGNAHEDRMLGIDLYFGDKAFLSPNLYHDSSHKWENIAPPTCPDQGWT